MRKVATFFTIATAVVVLSSCGSKTAETTESTDTVSVETNVENNVMVDSTGVTMSSDTAVLVDTTVHTH